MYKVVYNNCYGGFGLSDEALGMLAKLKNVQDVEELCIYDIPRHDPDLIKCIETLGSKANGSCANLQIAEIDENRYLIDEYDGSESVVTPKMMSNEWIVIKDERN